ncbi:P-loop containing nucleoside triphosphate hydrolase [Forsythia ovata]|uniref:P-loop containing nucleoside triphosphate hydrolase n=1 Tax=Forsythia ovata TaxID=205694 RepID=A0ABD1W8V4_9LAMI
MALMAPYMPHHMPLALVHHSIPLFPSPMGHEAHPDVDDTGAISQGECQQCTISPSLSYHPQTRSYLEAPKAKKRLHRPLTGQRSILTSQRPSCLKFNPRSATAVLPEAPDTTVKEEVYQLVGSPLVKDALSGYNTTLLAYGQVALAELENRDLMSKHGPEVWKQLVQLEASLSRGSISISWCPSGEGCIIWLQHITIGLWTSSFG